MIKWIRPSGSAIETGESEDTIAFAKLNGWKRVKLDKHEIKKEAKKERKKDQLHLLSGN